MTGVKIGEVVTWDTGCGLREQALKVAEEEHEVYDAVLDLLRGVVPKTRENEAWVVDECCDLIVATCNLLAKLGVEDVTRQMGACIERQRMRGRL